jgi:subtilase family serine protease
VWAGIPYPTSSSPKAVDAGAMTAGAAQSTITVTVALKLHDPDGAHALVEAMYTPGSPQFQNFLTPDEFRQRFAATDAEAAKVTASLSRFGLSATRATSTTLQVTGTPAAFEQAFSTKLHRFNVAAQAGVASYSFRDPIVEPQIPADVGSLVHAVIGLSTRPQYRPRVQKLPARFGAALLEANGSATANTSGTLTVLDFAKLYDVKPLYDAGVRGAGKTIGIVTLAGFTPSDAFAYWRALGLPVSSNRITVVNIDGGPGAPSDASGSDETTLDVEQSGGIAPAAKIIVYQAPNTDQGFLDAFAKAVDSNTADSISTSWGEWEEFIDPSPRRAYHEVFLQAALQGQSMFAASGDAGAYDASDNFPPPDYSLVLSVDHPAADPLMSAAGGTTLPGRQSFGLPNGSSFVVDIKNERAWSWDYLVPLCTKLGLDPVACGIFPVGGGGGVSVLFGRPFYQDALDGVQRSQPHQVLVDNTVNPPQTILALPDRFPGRNVPDISANADPDTGYSLYYTSDVGGFSVVSYYGGTSFVAPQLAGVTALLGESIHHRVGLLNFPLYLIARGRAYGSNDAPIRVIKDGNNDFYQGSAGYNPAVGLGVLDVAKFATALKVLTGH